jgi:hypothetical protein
VLFILILFLSFVSCFTTISICKVTSCDF